jgi:hypothetical protein
MFERRRRQHQVVVTFFAATTPHKKITKKMKKKKEEFNFKLPLCPLISNSRFKCVALATTSTFPLSAPSSALLFQTLPNSNDGLNTK